MVRIILLAVLAILLIRMLLYSRMEKKKPLPWEWRPWQSKGAFSRKGVPKSLGEYIEFKEVKKKR